MDPHVAAILRSLTAEEIDMLRDAFIFLDRDSDGYISLDELLEGVQEMVVEERFLPLKEYLNPLFCVADKDKDDKLSLTEFLMSFGDGPGVVPADVINSCVAAVRVRLSDEEISALQDNFRQFDKDEDGFLNRDELKIALRSVICDKFPNLTDSNFEEIITVVLKSADRNGDGKLSLAEFIRSYQEDQGVLPAAFVDSGVGKTAREIAPGELTVLQEAFAVLDKNNDGFIDVADLYQALWEMLGSQVQDKGQITDLCDMIVTTAGRGKTANLSLPDFVAGFLQNMEILEMALIGAKDALHKAGDSLQTMLAEGKLDHLVIPVETQPEEGGEAQVAECIDSERMIQLLIDSYKPAFPEWDEEVMTNVMTAIVYGAESCNSGRLSLNDFIRSFVEGSGMLNLDVSGNITSLDGTSNARPYTASSEDLGRISEALRILSEESDDDGCVTLEKLSEVIYAAFPESEEGAKLRLEYVVNNFVNQLEDGRLGWNENVRFVEEQGDSGEIPENPTGDAESTNSAKSAPHEEPSTQEAVAETSNVPAQPTSEAVPVTEPSKVEEQVKPTERTPAGHPEVKIEQVELDEIRYSEKEETPKKASPPVSTRQASPPAQLAAQTPRPPVPIPAATDLIVKKPTVASRFIETRAASKERKVVHPNVKVNSDPVYESELRELFSLYDTAHCGYLDREAFKTIYLNMEHYGLEPSKNEIENLFNRYSNGSKKIHFNEFCVIMLQRVRL